jgi:aspartate kinase
VSGKWKKNLALVAMIGNDLSKACGVGKEVFGVLEPFNIRMICYGASSHNLCFLVPGYRSRAGCAEAAS